MSYIFNKGKLLKQFKKHSIECDWKSQESIDQAIKDLAIETCNSDSFIGAGVDRSVFDIGDNMVIKIDKEYYVDPNDGEAEEEYYSNCYDSDVTPEYGDWAHDDIAAIDLVYAAGEQNQNEVDEYLKLQLCGRAKRIVNKIYAAISSCNIIICEKCEDLYNAFEYDIAEAMRGSFYDFIDDTHSGNMGLNQEGHPVVIDLGFGVDYSRVGKYFKIKNWNKIKDLSFA